MESLGFGVQGLGFRVQEVQELGFQEQRSRALQGFVCYSTVVSDWVLQSLICCLKGVLFGFAAFCMSFERFVLGLCEVVQSVYRVS